MPERRRILLVDDELSIVKMVGKRLEVAGYEVLIAMNGEEALTKAQQEHPDLIVLDIMLPKLDGYEVCRRLKQDARHQKIPILMLTAKVKEKDEKAAMAVGANAYVRKPFRAEELLGKIETLLTGSPPA